MSFKGISSFALSAILFNVAEPFVQFCKELSNMLTFSFYEIILFSLLFHWKNTWLDKNVLNLHKQETGFIKASLCKIQGLFKDL